MPGWLRKEIQTVNQLVEFGSDKNDKGPLLLLSRYHPIPKKFFSPMIVNAVDMHVQIRPFPLA